MRKIVFLLGCLAVFLLSAFYQKPDNKNPTSTLSAFGEKGVFPKLSDYHFFEGKISDQKPTSGVIFYSLNTPLFSDYAEKLRFIKLPENTSAEYNDKEVFEFPVGTKIIKTFYFPVDFRDGKKGRKLVETRLLIHENDGWKALEYVWNDEQTEAFLEVAEIGRAHV